MNYKIHDVGLSGNWRQLLSVCRLLADFVDFKYLERPKKKGNSFCLIRPYLRPVIKPSKLPKPLTFYQRNFEDWH